MFPSPNPNPEGLEKPEGEGRPNDAEENLMLEKVGDIGGSELAAMTGDDAVAPVKCSSLLDGTFPSAIFCASCRMTALPGDSNPFREFTQPWSLGDSCGRGENERGETGNGEMTCLWSEEKLPKEKRWLLEEEGGLVAIPDCD
jgi:hypothetical protein